MRDEVSGMLAEPLSHCFNYLLGAPPGIIRAHPLEDFFV